MNAYPVFYFREPSRDEAIGKFDVYSAWLMEGQRLALYCTVHGHGIVSQHQDWALGPNLGLDRLSSERMDAMFHVHTL